MEDRKVFINNQIRENKYEFIYFVFYDSLYNNDCNSKITRTKKITVIIMKYNINVIRNYPISDYVPTKINVTHLYTE